MTAEEFKYKIKGVVSSLFEVADDLDQRGVGKQINKSGGGSLREMIRLEILIFVFKVLNSDQILNDEAIKYLNECLDCNLTLLDIEVARKKTLDNNYPQLSVILPSFIIIDSQIGGNKFSSVYVETISFVTIGLLNCKGTSLQETVNYCRRISIYSDMIKRCLECELDFDPMKHISEEHKTVIEVAIKIDEKLNPYESEKKYLDETIETIKKSIQEDKDKKKRVKPEDENEISNNENEERIADESKLMAIDRLNQLVGLRGVKEQIQTIFNVQVVNKKCAEYNIKRQNIGMNMLFTGNPGTGKTTVARLIGEIYHDKGLLSKGQFVEVSRADLVGKYVGHTAQIVKDTVKKAKGGVLFIDEAYSLSRSGNDFGQEAIDTLVKEIEDNRDDLVVIAAGYPALMQEFMEANPGLRSRFPITVEFPDYSADDLLKIFRKYCSDNSFDMSAVILERVKATFKAEVVKKKRNFGNARMVRNYFDKMIMNHANRLVRNNMLDAENITVITIDDLPRINMGRGDYTNHENDFHVM